MKMIRRDLTCVTIKLQDSDYPNTWSCFFLVTPTKRMLLGTLQQELKREVEESNSGADLFKKLIEAINLWDGSSGSICCAGTCIAEVTCAVTDYLYEPY